jgi:hypothetical protein
MNQLFLEGSFPCSLGMEAWSESDVIGLFFFLNQRQRQDHGNKTWATTKYSNCTVELGDKADVVVAHDDGQPSITS